MSTDGVGAAPFEPQEIETPEEIEPETQAEAPAESASAAAPGAEQGATGLTDGAFGIGAFRGEGLRSAEAQWGSSAYGGDLLRQQLSKWGASEAGAACAAGEVDAAPLAARDERLDLSTPEKRLELLDGWGQNDDSDETKNDDVRCQSNTAIAGALMAGGPDGLAAGLDGAAKVARLQADGALDDGDRARWDKAAKDLDAAAKAARDGTLTRADLDRASEALYATFKNPDRDPGGSLSKHQSGMSRDEMDRMEFVMGLAGWGGHETVGEDTGINLAADNKETSDNVWAQIPPGGAAHVSAHSDGYFVDKGVGPHGEKVEKTKQGNYYYMDASSGGKIWLKPDGAGSNHALVFGRDDDGRRYIYNPQGDPRVVREDPDDPDEFDRLSARYMPKNEDGDYESRVTRYRAPG